MDKAWENLKRQWEENPMQVILVGSVAATAAAKLIDAWSGRQGRKAYARQVDLRAKGR